MCQVKMAVTLANKTIVIRLLIMLAHLSNSNKELFDDFSSCVNTGRLPDSIQLTHDKCIISHGCNIFKSKLSVDLRHCQSQMTNARQFDRSRAEEAGVLFEPWPFNIQKFQLSRQTFHTFFQKIH